MHSLHLAASLLAAEGGPEFNPDTTLGKFKALLIGLVSLFLLVISLFALNSAGRRGDTKKAASMLGATLLCLIPAVLGLLGIGLSFGAAFLGWAVPGLGAK